MDTPLDSGFNTPKLRIQIPSCRKPNYKLITILFVFVTICNYFLFFYSPVNTGIEEYEANGNQGPYDDATANMGNFPTKPKKILIWNAYWGSTALWHKIFFETVYKQCPKSNCVMTLDKGEENDADAILFHLVDLPKERYSFPQGKRNPDQVWIAMSYEPPYILKEVVGYDGNLSRLNGIFNRTMTYRSDADIVVRHGTYLRITKDTQFPNYFSDWVGSRKSTADKNYAAGKDRLVSWFASSRECKSQSLRETYVQELQKYIPVHIYGDCGPYKCGLKKTMRFPYKVEEDDCYLLVSTSYKFVLAFENSICEDYVTEKLYNNLKLNVVPVLLGGADYSKYAPPRSYIDASKYTPKDLAEYLELLDNNDTLYNEYFEWKQHYYIASHDGVPLACDLCHKLNNPDWRKETKVYEDLDAWFERGCKRGWANQRKE